MSGTSQDATLAASTQDAGGTATPSPSDGGDVAASGLGGYPAANEAGHGMTSLLILLIGFGLAVPIAVVGISRDLRRVPNKNSRHQAARGGPRGHQRRT